MRDPRKGIGSHEVAAIVAADLALRDRPTFNTYKTAGDVWGEYMGLTPGPDPTDAPLWWGQAMEPVILKRWCLENGIPESAFTYPCPTVWHPEKSLVDGLPYMRFTADAVRVDHAYGLDCKASDDWGSRDEWGLEGTDEVPLKLNVQGQWGMALYRAATKIELPEWKFVVKLAASNWKLRTYTVPGNRGLQDKLVGIVARWFEKHVYGNEPPPDTSGATLAAHYGKPQGVILPMDDALRALKESWQKVKIDRDAADTEKTKIENEIRRAIGTAEGIEGLATWKADKNGKRTLREWKD